MKLKIAIIKLAAIGDVAITAKAVSSYFSPKDVEIHWVIDKNFLALAKALLPNFEITFHPFDATNLFQGSLKEKLHLSLGLSKLVQKLNPDFTLLLHRDWRYRFILRALNPSINLKCVSRTPISEFKNYIEVFKSVPPKPVWSSKETQIDSKKTNQNTQIKLGILLGGANNAKNSYIEKRWPHFQEFLRLLNQKSNFEVHLYGSLEDREVLKGLSSVELSRFQDKVGKIALELLPAELSTLDCFVSIDSGLAHIAAKAMSSKTQKIFTLFGPTSAKIWSPQEGPAQVKCITSNEDCSPCNSNDGNFKPCRYTGDEFAKCMKNIKPHQLLDLLQNQQL